MRDTIGIGFVGTGFAEKVQMPGFRHAPGARMVAVSSGRRASAERAAAAFDIPHVFDDHRALAEDPKVDLVVVSSPPFNHRPAVLAAIAAGKHVLCEKPMALDAAEAREMADAAEAAGVLNLIDHELRFGRNRLEAKRRIESGYVGDVRHLGITFRNDADARGARPYGWWFRAEAGGGILGALGSHAVDAAAWLVAPVEAVDCELRTFVKQRADAETGELRDVDSDEYCSLRLALAGGAAAEASLMYVAPGPQAHRVEVVGSEGTLLLDDIAMTLTGARRDGEREDLTADDSARGLDGVPDTAWARGFVHYARAIVAALREGRTDVPGAATFRDGARTQEVLDAARAANASGCRVRL